MALEESNGFSDSYLILSSFAKNVRCKFSVEHYLDTINEFRDNGYEITPVCDYFDDKVHDKHVLLRHDVDMSLDYALEMALLEKDNGIHSTYYILMHSNLYNAMAPDNTDKIREIKRAGHEIGLHIDTRYYQGFMEFEMLAHIAQCNIVTWAQHFVTITPQPPMLRYNASDVPYKYISDSAMNFREGCFCGHIGRREKLHLLLHPEWWMCDPKGRLDKFEVMQKIAREAGGQAIKSFRGFEDIVREYVQALDLYPIAS